MNDCEVDEIFSVWQQLALSQWIAQIPHFMPTN
jgi:hypothetical protein